MADGLEEAAAEAIEPEAEEGVNEVADALEEAAETTNPLGNEDGAVNTDDL
jgi:hypothetical protein